MTEPAILYVDPDVAFAGHRKVAGQFSYNAPLAAKQAFEEAIARCRAAERTPVMVEVTIRVAPVSA